MCIIADIQQRHRNKSVFGIAIPPFSLKAWKQHASIVSFPLSLYLSMLHPLALILSYLLSIRSHIFEDLSINCYAVPLLHFVTFPLESANVRHVSTLLDIAVQSSMWSCPHRWTRCKSMLFFDEGRMKKKGNSPFCLGSEEPQLRCLVAGEPAVPAQSACCGGLLLQQALGLGSSGQVGPG